MGKRLFAHLLRIYLDASEDLDINGKKLHLSMLHNPSHLEVGKQFEIA